MLTKFQELVDICKKLRSEEGCPWDREQTFESMKKCILDESAEVAEAIDKNDVKNLEEELGDLLFNIFIIAQIASEKGDFDLKSVLHKIGEKIVSRHTWVFGSDKATTAEEALELWRSNKVKERSKNQSGENNI